MEAGEGYIDVEDLARYLKVKKRTAYKFVATLNIPHYKVGRLLRFRLSEVENWMKEQKADLLSVPYQKIERI